MRTLFFLFLMMGLITRPSLAQDVESVAVRDVILQLFKGMEKGDSAMVRRAFTKEVTLATIYRDKQNVPQLRREASLNGFLKAIGTPRKETWYEEFWNLKIEVDGDLAQAWCDYAFYLNNTFSHCGVDAFHLHKEEEGWKIFHLTDTRRKQPCEIPAEIQDKHK